MQPNCSCGEKAKWFYAPAKKKDKVEKIVFCDNCIPRGCSCSDWDFDEIKENELKNFKEVKYEGGYVAYRPLDSKGREEPCCEYDFHENKSDWDWFEGNNDE